MKVSYMIRGALFPTFDTGMSVADTSVSCSIKHAFPKTALRPELPRTP